ncbi:hypothetical protein AB2B38_009015 [Balneola sp. MJW-20]|uniref:hypothetical protein n=1 Tax=Gracilimonas aurantiaca TaxID=3234185 RepID=UPI003465E4B7
MNILMRINQWWLAAFTVCSPIIGIGFFITGFKLGLSGLIYTAIPLLILIPVTITALWLFSTGKLLYKSKKRRTESYRHFKLFRGSMLVVIFYALLLSVVLLFSVDKFFSFHYFSELFRLEMHDLFNLSIMLLPLHFISVCGSWYGMHFIARHMDNGTEGRTFSPQYFRNLAMMVVIPFGLAKIHPDLKASYAEKH